MSVLKEISISWNLFVFGSCFRMLAVILFQMLISHVDVLCIINMIVVISLVDVLTLIPDPIMEILSTIEFLISGM